jgi:hypothetical protein
LRTGDGARQRREVALEPGREHAPEAGRLRDALEVEVAELLAPVLHLDRVGDEDLAAAGGLADASRMVDGEPDVAVAGRLCAPAVQAHADAERRGPILGSEVALCLHGGVDSVRGILEGGKELVAAPVDDAPPVRLDRGANDLAVPLEHVAVVGAQLRE